MKPRVFYNMPEHEYRSGEILSQSTAHLMLTKSPRHAKLAFSRPRKQRSGMAQGTLIHELLLGGDSIRVLDVKDYKTDAAKILRANAISAGFLPVKRAEYDAAKIVADELLEELANEHDIKLAGNSEVSIFWDEEALNGDIVKCRTRIDHLDLPRIYDIKTIRSADDRTCSRHIDVCGYDIQAAAELRAVAAAFPEWADRLEFIDVFVEVDEPPHIANPIWPGPQTLAMGTEKWLRAIEIWARCQASGKWQGYSQGIHSLEAPPYALARHAEQMAEYSSEPEDHD